MALNVLEIVAEWVVCGVACCCLGWLAFVWFDDSVVTFGIVDSLLWIW